MARAKTFTRNSLAAVVAVAMVFAGAVSASASTHSAPSAVVTTGALKSATTVHGALATQASFTPKLSGSAAVGLTLGVAGLPSGATFTYRWKRNGASISAATQSTYKIVTADLGKKLTVAVTSKRSGYTTLTKTSASTATVVKQFRWHTPTISGTAKVGAKLTATTAAWSPTPTFTHQWYRDGVAISGATASTHTLTSSDAGAKITVRFTGHKSGYLTTSRTSAATSTVAAAAPITGGAGFPVGAGFDYQLGGAYAPPTGVGIVTRDNADSPAAGLWNICYINGFQTQPGQSGTWSSTLVLHNAAGKAVADPDWPDEYLLDTSTSAKRTAIAGVLAKVVATCAKKGFDAVEFDNLDSYTRSGGLLTAAENIAMAKLLVSASHANGLLAAQKNTVELTQQLHDQAGFDFAVAEECLEYGECAGYKDVYGSKVLEVEYSDNSLSLAQVCASTQRMTSVVYRDRDLVAKGQSGYVFGKCS